MFAALRCSVARASLSATHELHRMSSEWRDDSRGPMARIDFPPPASHTNPITTTDRVPADEQLGKPGNVGGSEETQMTITGGEILHRACPRSIHLALKFCNAQ